MSVFYLGLGSNQGERLSNLMAAIDALGDCGDVTKLSSIYESEPKYDCNQPKFLNMVCEIETELAAIELFEAVKVIEQQLGRIPSHKNGPRLIDIDLLFSEQESCESASLQVPHPRLAERAFVLVPWAEITPDMFVPPLSLTVQQLLGKLETTLVEEVKFFHSPPPIT